MYVKRNKGEDIHKCVVRPMLSFIAKMWAHTIQTRQALRTNEMDMLRVIVRKSSLEQSVGLKI